MTFSELLTRAGITKKTLSDQLGMSYRTIIGWKDDPPSYAEAYLKLLIEYNRYAP